MTILLHRSYTFLVISVLILPALLFAQGQIIHTPARILFPGQDEEIEAVLEGTTSGVREVRLLYNRAGQTGYLETSMEYRGGYYVGMIPADFVTEEGLRYLIVAELNDGSILTYPEQDAYKHPVEIRIESQAINTSYQMNRPTQEIPEQEKATRRELILAPSPGATVSQEEVLVAVTLFSLPAVDSSSIILSVDEVNVTRHARVGKDLVTYRPSKLLPGSHTVEMTFSDTTGRAYSPLNWQFQVEGSQPDNQAGLYFIGDAYVENSYSRIRNRFENVNKLGGEIRTTIGGASLHGNVYYTSRENSRYQPRNRYALELNSPRIHAMVGDFYPQFTRLGMWGKRIRGLNTQLDLNPFHLHFIYGNSQRLVEGIPSITTNLERRQGYNWGVQNYTFGRRVIGVRPSIGNGQHFKFGVSLISARDDTLGLLNALPDTVTGNISWRGTTPKDNLLVGSDLFFAFDQSRITWASSAALSWQNDNIFGGALTRNDTLRLGNGFTLPISALPLDPGKFSRLFIINDNIRPLLPFPAAVSSDPADSSAYLVNFSPFRFNEYSSLAYETKLSLEYFRNNLTLQYRRVGPEYSALANPYLRRDVAGFEIADRIPLLQNKLHLTLRYQDYSENLSREKAAQLSSNTFSAGITFYPGQGLPVINLNVNQYQRANLVDTLQLIGAGPEPQVIDNRINNRAVSNVLTISQQLWLLGIQHDLQVSYMRSGNTDLVQRSPEYPDMGYALSLVSIEFQSHFDRPLITRIGYHNNTSRILGSQGRFQSLSIGGMYRLLQNALQLAGALRAAGNSGTDRFTRMEIESGATYRFLQNNLLSMNILFTQVDETSLSYSNLLYRLRYTYNF